MKSFLIACIALAMLCCFGIEGTLRKLDGWGKTTGETAHRVYCELHREACDYIEQKRLEQEERRAHRPKLRRKSRLERIHEEQGMSEAEWDALDKRGKKL